jgi:dethiobiotin synthetase
MSVIVAGIHTGTGKTICSAILCQATGFDYWKPVQAGDLDRSDSLFVREIVSNPACTIHPERYRLNTPISPHEAAKIDGVEIRKSDFQLPDTRNQLVVETAGGVMSPLAEGFLIIDLIALLKLPVVLVSGNYLGSINHTLLSIEALNHRHIPVHGIIFNGPSTPSSESFILKSSKLKQLFSVPTFDALNRKNISDFVNAHPITLP